MSGIPLYTLPVVVLRVVFQQLGLPEIFNISLCSHRSQQNVEFLMRKGKSLKVHLNASEDSLITVQRSCESLQLQVAKFSELIEMPQAVHSVNINGTSVQITIVGQTLYLADKKNAFKDLGKHIIKVFRCQFERVILGDSDSSHIPTWVIDLVNSQQDPVKTLYVDGKNPSVSDVSHLFTKAKVSDHFMCSLEFTSKGPRPAITMGRMSVKSFNNLNSSWMTIEHLLNLNFEIGRFAESCFRSIDVNRFLKHWMSGGCDRLQEMSIELYRSMDYNEVFRGIDHEVMSSDDVMEYNYNGSNYTVEICGGIQFRRKSDGKVARLLNTEEQSRYVSFYVFG